MTDLVQRILEATFEGVKYEFRIPSMHDEINIGMRAREIRRKIVGADGDAGEDGLDWNTVYLCRCSATMEVLLARGPQWVFSAGPDGKPIVDSAQWAPENIDDVLGAVGAFRTAHNTFRNKGTANKPAPGTEAVAGQPGSGNVAV